MTCKLNLKGKPIYEDERMRIAKCPTCERLQAIYLKPVKSEGYPPRTRLTAMILKILELFPLSTMDVRTRWDKTFYMHVSGTSVDERSV